MLTRAQKEKLIEELADKIKRQKSLVFTDITGINVAQIQDLRKKLREAEIEYKVAKKTLIHLALDKEKQDIDISNFRGSIGLAFGYKDSIAPIKIISKFAKENKKLKVLAGIMEKKVLTLEEIKELANLPSRDELLAMLVGSLKNPISRFVNVLQGNIRNLLLILKQIKI